MASQNRQVKSGHSVGLRPCASWYQLAQPPVFQTVGAIFSCTPTLKAPRLRSVTSTVVAWWRSMKRSAPSR
ncbi:MAG: hypothetical protein WKF43_05775 [Acidimicrobiales bacterium]